MKKHLGTFLVVLLMIIFLVMLAGCPLEDTVTTETQTSTTVESDVSGAIVILLSAANLPIRYWDVIDWKVTSDDDGEVYWSGSGPGYDLIQKNQLLTTVVQGYENEAQRLKIIAEFGLDGVPCSVRW